MSFAVTNKSKRECTNLKKRKRFAVKDEPLFDVPPGTSSPFKKALLAEDSSTSLASKKQVPNIPHFRRTNAYTKIVANPGLLPKAPKIFQINTHQPKGPIVSKSFLIDLMTLRSFNSNVNERFNNVSYRKIEQEKNLTINNEEVLEEKIKNEEKQKEKKMKKKKEEELIQLQAGGSSEEDNCVSEIDEYGVSKKIKVYRVIEKKALIFHMHHPFKFSFQGELKITVITGEVEMCGFTLGSESVNAYSPDFCAPLTMETKSLKENKPAEEMECKLKNFLSEEDCKTILSEFVKDDTIILVEQVLSTFGIVINKYFEKLLFPKDLEDVSSETQTSKSLQSIFTFQLPKRGKYFRKSPEWDKIPLGQITALCGGKGVGKSTLLKYYINKLVSFGEKVLCLDFDPGQPEFTFPGCLSAVIIDQPLLGPNFTHVIDPFVMISFGDVNVTHNPSRYLESVKYVIQTCRKNEELPKMKWFVNTMGFCKGLGVNLIFSILKLLKPSTVIQIKSSDIKNNFPVYLTPAAVNSRSGYASMPLDDVNLSYDLRVIYSCAEYKKKLLQGGLKQRQLRDLMAISYLSRMVSPPFYNFNAVQPFLIPFSKLYLGIDFLVDPKDVLKAFNGNIVSLLHFQPDTEDILSAESEEGVYFKVVVRPKVSPSLGIGFVRGIDCQEKKIYIITHLPVGTLDEVNCLSLGRVSPPHSMFLRQGTIDSSTVYTTLGTISTIQRVKRMFRVPGTPQIKGKFSA